MEKSKIKTGFLIILIFISILQTGELWFGSLPNRNFFYNLFQKSNYNLINNLDEPIHLLVPEKIIINFGVEGGAYSILKNTTVEFKTATDEMTKILTNVFLDGEDIIEEDLNWTDILSKKAILYKYSGIIPTEGLTAQNNIVSQIPKFDQILIVPNKTSNQNTNFYFINEKDAKAYRVYVKQDTQELLELINKSNEDTNKIIYISTKQRNINQFINNVFLPTFNTPPVYKNIVMTNPVMMGDSNLEKIVNPLLSNPDLKKKQQTEDGITYYMEGNTIVKYFPEGVIEYTDQSISGKQNNNMCFIEAYQVAKSFLDKHQNSLDKEDLLNNFLYLSGQIKTDTGWEFYFDLKVQDTPYMFSQEIMKEVGMKHAVKIVVEDNKVKLYRRLIWEGKLQGEQEINVDYLQAIEEIIDRLKSKGIEDIKIKDMYWAYYQRELDTNSEIYWMVNVDGQIYPVKASR